MVNQPPQTNSKVDILSVSYSLEQLSYLTQLKHQFCHFFPVAGLPNRQAPVVQKLDSAIHRINLYPVDK